MLGFQRHEIPIIIQELEFNKNTAHLQNFRSLIKKMRIDENSYTQAFSALIYEDFYGRGCKFEQSGEIQFGKRPC